MMVHGPMEGEPSTQLAKPGCAALNQAVLHLSEWTISDSHSQLQVGRTRGHTRSQTRGNGAHPVCNQEAQAGRWQDERGWAPAGHEGAPPPCEGAAAAAGRRRCLHWPPRCALCRVCPMHLMLAGACFALHAPAGGPLARLARSSHRAPAGLQVRRWGWRQGAFSLFHCTIGSSSHDC